METTLISIASVLTALGGVEFVKYFFSRSSHSKAVKIETARQEFNFVKESILFLQEEMTRNHQEIKRLQDLVLQLTREKGLLEGELQLKRCERRKCLEREPQSGY